MLKIYIIDSEYKKSAVDLHPNTSITLNLKNPMFNDIGSHTLSFSIPATNNNKKIFLFPERPEKYEGSTKEFDCEISFNNKKLSRGTINIQQADYKNFKAFIKIGDGDFYGLIKEKYMTELELGGDRNIGADYDEAAEYYTDTVTGTYQDYDFVLFPVMNTIFYNDSSFETEWADYKIVNYWNARNYPIYDPAYKPQYEDTYMPFPYLIYVLKQIFAEHGYEPDENIFESDSELSTLTIYNTYAAVVLEKIDSAGGGSISAATKADPCQITCNNHQLSDGDLVYIEGVAGMTELNDRIFKTSWVNTNNFTLVGCDSTNYTTYTSGGTATEVVLLIKPDTNINLANHMPNVTIGQFLNGLKNLFNVCIFPNIGNKKIKCLCRENIIMDEDYIDITDKIEPSLNVYPIEEYDGFKLSYEYDSADSYISDNIKQLDGLNLQDEVDTFDDLPNDGNENNDVRLVIDENLYYIWSWDPVNVLGSWNFHSFNYVSKTGGEQELVIESKISTLAMYSGHDEWNRVGGSSPYYLLIPQAEQIGNNPALYQFVNNAFTPRLLFYRGMYDNSSSVEYPLGSSDVYDYDGNIIANYSLSWNGKYGLYENFWKNYLYWYLNIKQKVETNIILSIEDIVNLKFYKKHRIKNVNYFIDSIQVNISNNKISTAKITLFKC